ncbi:hypothetical protein XENOCAPTIV_017062 [Xenoophorus captivus]|uniref:Uncharacterized protein n=1 Tax=Xenoophorus captivus TaxID=1517983 RepID=A0ABV0SDC6_9TELE
MFFPTCDQYFYRKLAPYYRPTILLQLISHLSVLVSPQFLLSYPGSTVTTTGTERRWRPGSPSRRSGWKRSWSATGPSASGARFWRWWSRYTLRGSMRTVSDLEAGACLSRHFLIALVNILTHLSSAHC